MKHLFVIHSNITYLAALGTICAEKLELKDVIITSRIDLKIKEPVPVVYFPFEFEKKRFFDWWVLHPYKYIDRFIEKYIDKDSFTAYLEVMTMPGKLFVSSPQCVGYHFIEEGGSAYVQGTLKTDIEYNDFNTPTENLRTMSFREKLKSIILIMGGMSMRNFSMPFFYDAYFRLKGVNFYGFGTDSFKEAQRKVEISWGEIAKTFKFDKKYIFSNASLWLGICCDEPGVNIPMIDYIAGIENKCVPHLIDNNVTQIYVKHHPRATMELRKREIDVFLKAGIEVKTIEDNICMEIELIGEVNVSIYMLQTSLYYYARQMGHDKIYSIASYFPEYMKRCAVDDIWNNVIML